ncbi:hypothetical protein V2V06_21160 [Paenibacillus polymyxa]|nr:hypothetical protein [Paenibacillus polymyxa]
MKIVELEVMGLKIYEQLHKFTFGMVNRIEGGRDQGKTALSEAIVWCIKGCNLAGETRGVLKQLKNVASKELRVTSIWDLGYPNHNRYKVSRISKGRSTRLYLDDELVQQDIIDDLFGSVDLFLSVFIPGFIGGLSAPRIRDLIHSILPKPSHKAVLNSFKNEDRTLLEVINIEDPHTCLVDQQKELSEWDEYIGGLKVRLNSLQFQVKLQEGSPVEGESDILVLQEQFQTIQEEKGPELEDYVIEMIEEKKKLGEQYRELEDKWKQLRKKPLPRKERLQIEVHQRQLDLDEIASQCRKILDDGYHLRDLIKHAEAMHEQDLVEFSQYKAERLQETQNQINLVLAKRNFSAGLKSKKGLYECEMNKLMEATQERQRVAEQLNMIQQYVYQYAKLQVEMANNLLQNAEIILTKRNLDTQVHYQYKLVFRGKGLYSLSRCEKISLSIEFSKLVNYTLKMLVPIFADTGDAMDKENIESQYFETSFVPNGLLNVSGV